jgi:hypothetical protein
MQNTSTYLIGSFMKQEFSAIIKQHERINGAYVEVPFDINEVFGAKRVKVTATFDGFPYRGSIVSMGGRYLLGLPQQIRREIQKDFGDTVLVAVEKDEEERVVELSSDFETGLKQNGPAQAFWDSLSFSDKKKYADWLAAAKKADTRSERIVKMILLLENNTKMK